MPSLRERAEKLLAAEQEAREKVEKDRDKAREEGGIRSDTGKSIFRECVERAGKSWIARHPDEDYYADGTESIVETLEYGQKAEAERDGYREECAWVHDRIAEKHAFYISANDGLREQIKLLREALEVSRDRCYVRTAHPPCESCPGKATCKIHLALNVTEVKT